jgi:hypothetical protein
MTKALSNRLKGALTLFAALLLALTVAGPLAGVARAQVTAENVAERIAAAKTAADHEALAAYFRQQAAAQADKVKLHEDMLARYKKVGGKPYETMITHCQTLLGNYRQAQKEYEALAEEHAKMAKEASGQD